MMEFKHMCLSCAAILTGQPDAPTR